MWLAQNDQTVKQQEAARVGEDLHGELGSVQEVMTWALLGSLEEDGQAPIPAESCGGCVAPSFSNCRGFFPGSLLALQMGRKLWQ